MSVSSMFLNKSPRLLATAIFAVGSLAAVGQAPTTATNPCATGSATFSGQPGGTYSSPTNVIVKASTGAGCTLTEVRLYSDNKTYQSYAVNQPGPGVGGFNFQPVNLADGYHNIVGVAWNQDGYAFRTQDFSIFIANEDKAVYIVSPADNATLTNSTVHFDVRTRWDVSAGPNQGTQVTHVRVYLDNKDIYDYNGDHVDFYKTLAPGGHYVVAIAWNQSGNYIKSSSSFIVK